MKVTIKIFEEGKELLSKIFGEGVYRAGRSDFADLFMPSDSVSRSHVEFRVTDSAVYMTNMSSPGKVKVNGRTMETAELADGDELQVGPYRIVIYHGERDVQADPPPSPDAPAAAVEPPPDFAAAEGEANAVGAEALDEGGKAEEPPPEGAPEPQPAAEPFPGFDSPAAPFAEPLAVEGTAALSRSETQVEVRPVVAKLVFTEGPRAGEDLFLEAYEVTLGRSKKADIFLDDEKMSRIHAKISRVGMGYRLIDMNSRNGTYVNGMRILEHPLSSFDVIEIGNSKIKFIIHDLVAGEMARGGQLTQAMPVSPAEATKSLPIDPANQAGYLELQRPPSVPPSGPARMGTDDFAKADPKSRRKLLFIVAGVLLVLYMLLPSSPTGKKGTKEGTKTTATAGDTKTAPANVPASLPREWADLSPEVQRGIEGHYNSAIKAAEQDQLEDAVGHLRKIHEVIPYYKQSRELLDQFSKRLKEKQIAEAQQKAKTDEKQDLQIYIEEGLEYLKEGDFDRAAESFNSAIVIDPSNDTAIKGLKAAQYKVRSIEQIPQEKDPEQEKRKLVAELFQQAVQAFTNKSYQQAIGFAEKIRQIELKGDTQYLNEAKQIIDRARMLQKEEFEPFLIQAKEKYTEGDFNSSRDLCEEMLRRDPAYDDAKECVLKAKKQLNRLAKEAYTHGYILESMNRLEEAKQYWNRAKNYVRPGDDYYDKVNKKLDYYQ